MTHQQLLLPRWLVLGDWPGREHDKFNIGDIITDSQSPKELPRDQNGNLRWRFEWEKYPQLFKMLWWWEKRDKNELGEHVKFIKDTDNNEVLPVYGFGDYIGIEGFFIHESCKWSEFIWIGKHHLPATEEDYNQYITTK